MLELAAPALEDVPGMELGGREDEKKALDEVGAPDDDVPAAPPSGAAACAGGLQAVQHRAPNTAKAARCFMGVLVWRDDGPVKRLSVCAPLDSVGHSILRCKKWQALFNQLAGGVLDMALPQQAPKRGCLTWVFRGCLALMGAFTLLVLGLYLWFKFTPKTDASTAHRPQPNSGPPPVTAPVATAPQTAAPVPAESNNREVVQMLRAALAGAEWDETDRKKVEDRISTLEKPDAPYVGARRVQSLLLVPKKTAVGG